MNMSELEISENCEVRFITKLDRNELGVMKLQFSDPIYKMNSKDQRCTSQVKCAILNGTFLICIGVLVIMLIIALNKDHCGPQLNWNNDLQ